MITIWRRYECTQIDDTVPRFVWVPIPRVARKDRASLDPRREREFYQRAVRAGMAPVSSVDPYPGRDGLRYRKPLAFHWGVGLVDLIVGLDVNDGPQVQAFAMNFYEFGPLRGAWPTGFDASGEALNVEHWLRWIHESFVEEGPPPDVIAARDADQATPRSSLGHD